MRTWSPLPLSCHSCPVCCMPFVRIPCHPRLPCCRLVVTCPICAGGSLSSLHHSCGQDSRTCRCHTTQHQTTSSTVDSSVWRHSSSHSHCSTTQYMFVCVSPRSCAHVAICGSIRMCFVSRQLHWHHPVLDICTKHNVATEQHTINQHTCIAANTCLKWLCTTCLLRQWCCCVLLCAVCVLRVDAGCLVRIPRLPSPVSDSDP